jgi:hypothetical protein
MPKTIKKTTSKTRSRKTTKPAPRMGVPTVGDRLAAIERAILSAAAGFGVDEEDLCTLNPRCQPVKLSALEVQNLAKVLSAGRESACLLMELPPDVLKQLAPTYDQRNSFEEIGGVK